MGWKGVAVQKGLLIASLSSTRTELAEVFPHLSDDILEWAPTPGMRTIHGQLVEIIGTEVSIVERLMGGSRRPYKDIEAELSGIRTVSGLIEKLGDVRQTTLAFLASSDEDKLSAEAEVSDDSKKYMELSTVPVGEMIRYIVRHEAYHTGQLVSYLWARGNDPYSWD